MITATFAVVPTTYTPDNILQACLHGSHCSIPSAAHLPKL